MRSILCCALALSGHETSEPAVTLKKSRRLTRSPRRRGRAATVGCNAGGLRGLQIDGQLELDRLLDRQVAGLGPLEDTIDVSCRATIQVNDVRGIGYQSAGFDELCADVDGRYAAAAASSVIECGSRSVRRGGPRSAPRCFPAAAAANAGFRSLEGPHVEDSCKAERLAPRLVPPTRRPDGIVWVTRKRCARLRHQLFHQLDALCREVVCEGADAR